MSASLANYLAITIVSKKSNIYYDIFSPSENFFPAAAPIYPLAESHKQFKHPQVPHYTYIVKKQQPARTILNVRASKSCDKWIL